MVLHRQSSNLFLALRGRCTAYDIQASQGEVQAALAWFHQWISSAELLHNKEVE